MALRSIGVDVGGTRTKLVLLEHPGTVVESTRISSRQATPAALTDGIVEAVRAWTRDSPPPAGLGVAVPGLVDRSGCVVRAPNLPILDGFDIRAALQESLGLKAELDNDANVAGLAEARLGAAAGCHSAVCLTVGTGLGGAIIQEGRLWRGFSGMAGEVGRLRLNEDPADFFEYDVGAAAIVRNYVQGSDEPEDGLDAATVAARAAAGDAGAQDALARCGRRLGVVLALLVNVLNPERIVVGGGVAGAGEWYLAAARAEGERRAWAEAWKCCRVVPAELGSRAGAIGAALLIE